MAVSSCTTTQFQAPDKAPDEWPNLDQKTPKKELETNKTETIREAACSPLDHSTKVVPHSISEAREQSNHDEVNSTESTKLNFETVCGQWLDRNLPPLYFQAIEIYSQTINDSAHQAIFNHADSLPLLQKTNLLMEQYLEHLETYPDEVTLIRTFSNNSEEISWSENGYVQMHLKILEVLCKSKVVLEKFNIFLMRLGFMSSIVLTQTNLQMGEQEHAAIAFYHEQGLDNHLSKQVKLFNLYLDSVKPFQSDPKKFYLSTLEFFGLFIENASSVLETVECATQVGIEICSLLPLSKAQVEQLNVFDQIDSFMLRERYPLGTQHIKYIVSSLKFTQYLRKPDEAVFILEHLNLYDLIPDEDACNVLCSICSLFKQHPELQVDVQSAYSIPWTPFIACIFKLNSEAWYINALSSPYVLSNLNLHEFQVQVGWLKSILQNKYCRIQAIMNSKQPERSIHGTAPQKVSLNPPAALMIRAKIPKPPKEEKVKYKPEELPPFKQEQFIQVFQLPAFKPPKINDDSAPGVDTQLSKQQLGLLYQRYRPLKPPKGKTVESHINEQLKQGKTKAKKCDSEQNSWRYKANSIMEEYEDFFSEHSHPLNLMSIKKAYKTERGRLKADEVQDKHFALREFCFYLKKAIFKEKNHFQKLKLHCTVILTKAINNPEMVEAEIDKLIITIKELQDTLLELAYSRLLQGATSDDKALGKGKHGFIVGEVCDSFFEAWHSILHCFDDLRSSSVATQCPEKCSELFKIICQGKFYQNRSLLFNIWVQAPVLLTPDRQQTLCYMELITCCVDTMPTALRRLDNLECQSKPYLLKTVMYSISQHIIYTRANNPSLYKKIMKSVLESFKFGWLHNTWLYAVTLDEFLLQQQNNPLLLLKQFLADERFRAQRASQCASKTQKQIELEVQQQLSTFTEEELKVEDKTPPPATTHKGKKKARPYRKVILSNDMQCTYTPQVGVAKADSAKSSSHVPREIIQLEKKIPNASLFTIARFNALLFKYQADFQLSLRLQHDLIDASCYLMAPAIEAINSLETSADRLLSMLENSRVAPYKFKDTSIYEVMLIELRHLPSHCEKIETSLQVFCTHAETLKHLELPEESDEHYFFLEKIEITEAKINTVRTTLAIIQSALDCRREVILYRRNYKRQTNPLTPEELQTKKTSNIPIENHKTCTDADDAISRVQDRVSMFKNMVSATEP
ncbi:hypothetical protein D5018_01940 [Parashewanella curva]|uniref:Uncharacterized protein n=1 Tax=Parashewanella curva TaxID=2338552 RepID=A0A3L8Q1L5_9GAMM|nr:hypothetical protein [Parashewanella curva]RLV61474.1 hypothetical protein D5018_01940 [Parashewanella curva]